MLVVWQELQVDAGVALYFQRVFNVVAIEVDALVADGRYERILQQPDMVLVEVYVGKDILDNGIDDVARLKQVVDALRSLSHDDGLLRTGVAAIDLLRDGLIHADGQNHLTRSGADLHLLHQPGVALERPRLQLLWLQVVEREGYLLVLIILIVVVLSKVCLLFGGNHTTHQLHGGIILTTVPLTLGLDGHLAQFLLVGRQFDVQP